MYGVVAAYAAHLTMNWAETPLRWWWLAFALFVLGAELATYASNPKPNIAYAAHGYGALYGVGVALFTVRNVRVLRWERLAALLALIAVVGSAAVMAYVLSRRITEWEVAGVGGAPVGRRPGDRPF